MADLLKTAVIAGVVYKVLSKKKKDKKTDEDIRYKEIRYKGKTIKIKR